MRALIATDLHASNTRPMSKPGPLGLSDRFEDLLHILKQMFKTADDYEVNDLLLGGDLFDKRHTISFRLYNAFGRALTDGIMKSRTIKSVAIIEGNHDLEDQAGTESALWPFTFYPKVVLYRRGLGDYRFHDGERISMVPFSENPEKIREAFRMAPMGLPVFSHYAAEGCPLESDYFLASPVSFARCMEHPYVIFGHVHKPSDQGNGRVVYVGAPMHFDFGDHGPRGGLLLMDNQMSRVTWTSPVFVTANYPRVPMVPDCGGYLRVRQVPRELMNDVQATALKAGWRDVLVLPEATTPTEAAVMAPEAEHFTLGEATLRAHVDAKVQDPGEREAVVTTGQEILSQARSVRT
jgi:DNA repair exonuclease SbcCD nuclease subunit